MRWLDHRLIRHEFEQTLGGGGGQKRVACMESQSRADLGSEQNNA